MEIDMAGKQFSMEPKTVPQVETKYRRIVTQLPVPESIPIIERLRKYEPLSMSGQPLIVWDHAEGSSVYDKYGNMWLDWSSGVLVANAGHSNPKIKQAIIDQAQKSMQHSYCFANEPRSNLVQKLVEVAPEELDKVFLLTTGAESTENALKLCRTYGRRKNPDKIVMVSFEGAFHGRTLGSQQMGGIPSLKEWIGNIDPGMVQVPFPGDFRLEDKSFDLFEKTLADKGVDPANVCGVISETYQGGESAFLPVEYARKLAQWCKKNDALLVFDEVQAGFGRTGKMFGFEHYGVVPDMFCCGKGISSGLPISAVIGKSSVLDLYGPAEMTSTHSGNPICSAAALASLEAIIEGDLVENSRKMGDILLAGLEKIREKHPGIIGAVQGKGLVEALCIVKSGSLDPDYDMAFEIVELCIEKGLMMFAPVGKATVKIAPPLCITEEEIVEGLQVLAEAIDQATA
jgi:4-aminobutyrate aminotransferase / (S)-3-amino-2-methylpropionate transaminase / 5-aminovalerate transaminase